MIPHNDDIPVRFSRRQMYMATELGLKAYASIVLVGAFRDRKHFADAWLVAGLSLLERDNELPGGATIDKGE